jgi:signal transduction histidine kinase
VLGQDGVVLHDDEQVARVRHVLANLVQEVRVACRQLRGELEDRAGNAESESDAINVLKHFFKKNM